MQPLTLVYELPAPVNSCQRRHSMVAKATAVLTSKLRNHLRSSNLIGQCFFIPPLSIMVDRINSSGSFLNSYHNYGACDRRFM